MEHTTDKRFSTLRGRLLVNHPFYGSLLMRLNAKASTGINTLCVDGTTLTYNPDYLFGLPEDEQMGVMAHEVSHCALGHIYRRGTRDAEMWNQAADYAINPMLRAAGLTLPKDVLDDPQYAGLGAEKIYSKLRSQQPPEPEPGEDGEPEPDGEETGEGAGGGEAGAEGEEDADGAGEGDGDGTQEAGSGKSGPTGTSCSTGEFTDAPEDAEGNPADGAMSELDWQIAVEQAESVARAAGTMPGSMVGALETANAPRVDWVAETQEFFQALKPSDQAWSNPNRRFVSAGVFLPGSVKNSLGPVVLAIDTSGSTLGMRKEFAGEFTGIIQEARPEVLHVVYCDARVQKTEEVDPEDADNIKMESVGNGGTRWQPVLDWVEQNGIEPAALIYLTDLERGDMPIEPSYPVLWVAPDYCTTPVPFGQLVSVPVTR